MSLLRAMNEGEHDVGWARGAEGGERDAETQFRDTQLPLFVIVLARCAGGLGPFDLEFFTLSISDSLSVSLSSLPHRLYTNSN